MKKLLWIALAFIALEATAQQEKSQAPKYCGNHDMMMNIPAEEAANLKTKRMTLMLDLTEAQQNDIYELHLKNTKKCKAHMEDMKAKKEADSSAKPTPEEKAEMMNTMLDNKIEMKAKLKSILTPEQFAKWEKAQAEKPRKKGKKMGCCKMSE